MRSLSRPGVRENGPDSEQSGLNSSSEAASNHRRVTPIIESIGLSKRFARRGHEVEALRGISLSIREGEFVSLIGPSGSGKSTLLNIVAGFTGASAGQMLYRGAPVPRPNTEVGYITQKPNLLAWRTTAQNITLPLELQGVPRRERRRKLAGLVELVGLEGAENAYPSELSGGMRTRVSLARTLMYQPETLLADEPFGALDAQLKTKLGADFQRIWEAVSGTVLFVTHDLDEAVVLSDRILVFSPSPARLIDDIRVDLPRPRELHTFRFRDDFRQVYDRLIALLGIRMHAGGPEGTDHA